MQLTCSHGNKRASTFETCVAEIHWQTVSKDLGFATPTLCHQTRLLTDWPKLGSSQNQSLHLYLKLEQRWLG